MSKVRSYPRDEIVWMEGRTRWHAYLIGSHDAIILCRFTYSTRRPLYEARKPCTDLPVCLRCRINATKFVVEGS